MEKFEFKDFLSIINRAAIVYDIELSEDRQAVYWDIFKQYSIEQFKDAMNQVVRSCKFFPRPAEIIEFMLDDQLSIEDRATTQAMMVLERMQIYGSYGIPDWDDPTTDIVIKRGFGGWNALCGNQLSENNQWFIKDFIRLYRSFDNHTKYLELTMPEELKQIE